MFHFRRWWDYNEFQQVSLSFPLLSFWVSLHMGDEEVIPYINALEWISARLIIRWLSQYWPSILPSPFCKIAETKSGRGILASSRRSTLLAARLKCSSAWRVTFVGINASRRPCKIWNCIVAPTTASILIELKRRSIHGCKRLSFRQSKDSPNIKSPVISNVV